MNWKEIMENNKNNLKNIAELYTYTDPKLVNPDAAELEEKIMAYMLSDKDNKELLKDIQAIEAQELDAHFDRWERDNDQWFGYTVLAMGIMLIIFLVLMFDAIFI